MHLSVPCFIRASLGVQMINNLPVVRDSEGNGTLLQYSCLKNPRVCGAWWATVYVVTQSRT